MFAFLSSQALASSRLLAHAHQFDRLQHILLFSKILTIIVEPLNCTLSPVAVLCASKHSTKCIDDIFCVASVSQSYVAAFCPHWNANLHAAKVWDGFHLAPECLMTCLICLPVKHHREREMSPNDRSRTLIWVSLSCFPLHSQLRDKDIFLQLKSFQTQETKKWGIQTNLPLYIL